MNTITLEWLKRNSLRREHLNFFERNGLEGFPVDRLNEIEGDYNKFFDWVNGKLSSKCEYDRNGVIIKETCSDDRVYQYEYDEHGNLIKRSLLGITFWGGRTSWQAEYDDIGNMIKEWETLRAHSLYEYGDLGDIVKKKDQYNDAYQWEYKYDKNGNLIKKVYPFGALQYFDYEHYDNGQLKSIYRGTERENLEQILFIPKF